MISKQRWELTQPLVIKDKRSFSVVGQKTKASKKVKVLSEKTVMPELYLSINHDIQ